MSDDVRVSKRLSFWLRHQPQAASLVLDEQGWAEVGAVLAALNKAGVAGGLARLREVIENNDKQRFELSPDGRHIRARQGHSVVVDLQLPASVPPPLLYHGTVARFLGPIQLQGLRPMRRHHVHLSPDVATARRVGGRRGAPVILTVRALELHACGTPFYLTANGIWLAHEVPPSFIDVPGASGQDSDPARPKI